jgi:hypothetical protein
MMELNRSQSVAVDKALVICKLHEIVDYYLLGDGTWPLDRESLQAFCKTVRDLGLDEAVAGQPGMTRSTELGKELKLDLIMAFVGAWDMWEIPSVLEEHGYIDETETEALFSVPLFEGERTLKWLVLRTYFEFCDRSQRAN